MNKPRVMRGRPPKLTLEDVTEALFGPRCLACRKRRTTNPSKTCTECLGARCCSKCAGTGARPCKHTGVPSGCGGCAGTGVRRIVTR